MFYGEFGMHETSLTWVQSLKNSECYPHSVDHVRILETHISWVILTGEYAYKIKKPVKYSFVDFSTVEKRRWFCEEEVRLNRRLVPEVYLGVIPIVGSPDNPHIEGQGTPFEFAVKMKQFSSEQDIHGIVTREENGENFIFLLADNIATFHTNIERAGEHSLYGSPDMVWKSIKECLEEVPFHFLSQPAQKILTTIQRWLNNEWQNVSGIILERKQGGFVRECHGDLHLGNIAICEGRVCVFDALEFEPCFRWVDVMSEIAFLVMDLEKHGRQDLASIFLNRYLELTGDYEGLRVFRLYQVYRALVRAKVAGLRLVQLSESGVQKEKAKDEFIGYVELAHRFTHSSSPGLIIMHGVSGTGKTTVSTEIINTIGAVRVRSDVERKRMFAELLSRKGKISQDVDLYDSDMTTRTYDRLRDLARTLIQTNFLVVIDATFLRHLQRELFRRIATEQNCPWFIVDVCTPQEVLGERIGWRIHEGCDASDATIDVMERQKETEESFTPEERSDVIRVDSTNPASILLAISELKEKTRV